MSEPTPGRPANRRSAAGVSRRAVLGLLGGGLVAGAGVPRRSRRSPAHPVAPPARTAAPRGPLDDATGRDRFGVADPHVAQRRGHPAPRGYSFVDGTDQLGRLDAWLFFLAYQRDPPSQFVRIQRSLAGSRQDAMNEYIQHVGSGLFACPPGVRDGEAWGRALCARP